MGYASRANVADIPIVGQSFKVLVGYSTAIIECQCPAKTVLPLQGKNRVTKCPACGKGFAIAQSGTLQIGEVVSSEGKADA